MVAHPIQGRQRQKYYGFKARLGYTERLLSKNKPNNTNKQMWAEFECVHMHTKARRGYHILWCWNFQ